MDTEKWQFSLFVLAPLVLIPVSTRDTICLEYSISLSLDTTKKLFRSTPVTTGFEKIWQDISQLQLTRLLAIKNHNA